MPETLSLLTPAQVALRLGVSPRTVLRYAASGWLEGVPVGPRLIKITEESVSRVLAERLHPARQQGA
jgi:excisionase family DNA binding protein